MIVDNYYDFKPGLEKFEFITIICKYDQILGPRSLYSSFPVTDESFKRDLLRDALNTRNKFVIIDYGQFYSQVCKIDVQAENARGLKQLYAIILLRDRALPLIPTIFFQKIEMLLDRRECRRTSDERRTTFFDHNDFQLPG